MQLIFQLTLWFASLGITKRGEDSLHFTSSLG